MNRIILIGNGFDLAHGLPTKYTDFVNSYWADFKKALQYKDTGEPWYADDFITINYRFNGNFSWPGMEFDQHILSLIREKIHSISDRGIQVGYKNSFFAAINHKLSEQKWVNIENEYYRLLKDIHNRHTKSQDIMNDLEKLNADFAAVKEKMVDYLKKVQEEKKLEEIVNEQIRGIVFELFNHRDISNGGQNLFWLFQRERLNQIEQSYPTAIREYSLLLGQYLKLSEKDCQNERLEMHKSLILTEKYRDEFDTEVWEYFHKPDNILFLNFNYTRTAGLYVPKQAGFQLNNIHGELNNPNNPIIFGYGDEIDEDYKKILNMNENKYLHNIKSIRYLETDNYRRLLTFIDSAPYQIYIMGHSCGNSDRILLNTMFEHDNCVSIKPFYHKKEDGTDDYIDIVQNISRNFKDPAKMRDRVVNRTFCDAMPQNETAQKSE